MGGTAKDIVYSLEPLHFLHRPGETNCGPKEAVYAKKGWSDLAFLISMEAHRGTIVLALVILFIYPYWPKSYHTVWYRRLGLRVRRCRRSDDALHGIPLHPSCR